MDKQLSVAYMPPATEHFLLSKRAAMEQSECVNDMR
jgi:hypothetical protein